MEDYLTPIDNLITQKLIPTLLGCQISTKEREILALPLKCGGLGIPILKELANKEYSTSRLVTDTLVDNDNMKLQTHENGNEQMSQREKLQKVLERKKRNTK